MIQALAPEGKSFKELYEKERDEWVTFWYFLPQGIANKYPDFKSDHALALLLMRDVTRAEARQVRIWTQMVHIEVYVKGHKYWRK